MENYRILALVSIYGDDDQIRDSLRTIPNAKIIGTYQDGSVNVIAYENIKASSLEEIKGKMARKHYIGEYGVFNVYDEAGKVILTEEDVRR